MQLNLAFLDLPNPPSLASKSPASAAWDQLDEAARVAALERLGELDCAHVGGSRGQGGRP